MGSQEVKQYNKNIITFGITQLLQLDYIGAEWIKDEENSSIDFQVFTYHRYGVNLWCPQDTPMKKRVADSLINKITFEGVLFIVQHNLNMHEERRLLHWIMNEETMRLAVLFIVVVIPLQEDIQDDFHNDEHFRLQIQEELRLSEIDSRQPRQLFIWDLNLMAKAKDDNMNHSVGFTQMVKKLIQTAERVGKSS